MFEKFEEEGVWWLPENPEKKMHGTLSYSPENGAILKLRGSFEKLDGETRFRDYNIINGFAGSDFTLYKCFTKSYSTRIIHPETDSATYYANVVFKGHLFQKSSDIKFKDASVEYNVFASWFSHHTISASFLDDGQFSATAKPSESISVSIDKGLKISLISGNEKGQKLTPDGFLVTIQEKSFVDFETLTDMDFEQFMEISGKFQQFLTLVTNKPIWIQTLSISVPGEKRDINVFFEVQEHLLEKNRYVHPIEMPVSYEIISSKFENILKNWFEKNSIFREIFDLYFALQYNDKMFIEHRFLNLIFCLESYHRRGFNGQYLSDKNYEEFSRVIKNSLPSIDDPHYEAFKTKFNSILKYGNEPSLRKRLTLLCSDNSVILSNYIQNQGEFIEKVVNTRNYRTHFDRTLEPFIISTVDEYLDYNLKLKLLVELCIFKELGFGSDEIEGIFQRNREYERLKNHFFKDSVKTLRGI